MISEAHREKLRANIAKARAARFSKKNLIGNEQVTSSSGGNLLVTESKPPDQTFMEVHKLPINTRIVLAKDSSGVLKTVWVGNSATYTYGDKINVQPHPTDPTIWQAVDPPPRDRRRV